PGGGLPGGYLSARSMRAGSTRESTARLPGAAGDPGAVCVGDTRSVDCQLSDTKVGVQLDAIRRSVVAGRAIMAAPQRLEAGPVDVWAVDAIRTMNASSYTGRNLD